jgi:hypothetical protein
MGAPAGDRCLFEPDRRWAWTGQAEPRFTLHAAVLGAKLLDWPATPLD